jgi:hypothetical protein
MESGQLPIFSDLKATASKYVLILHVAVFVTFCAVQSPVRGQHVGLNVLRVGMDIQESEKALRSIGLSVNRNPQFNRTIISEFSNPSFVGPLSVALQFNAKSQLNSVIFHFDSSNFYDQFKLWHAQLEKSLPQLELIDTDSPLKEFETTICLSKSLTVTLFLKKNATGLKYLVHENDGSIERKCQTSNHTTAVSAIAYSLSIEDAVKIKQLRYNRSLESDTTHYIDLTPAFKGTSAQELQDHLTLYSRDTSYREFSDLTARIAEDSYRNFLKEIAGLDVESKNLGLSTTLDDERHALEQLISIIQSAGGATRSLRATFDIYLKWSSIVRKQGDHRQSIVDAWEREKSLKLKVLDR